MLLRVTCELLVSKNSLEVVAEMGCFPPSFFLPELSMCNATLTYANNNHQDRKDTITTMSSNDKTTSEKNSTALEIRKTL